MFSGHTKRRQLIRETWWWCEAAGEIDITLTSYWFVAPTSRLGRTHLQPDLLPAWSERGRGEGGEGRQGREIINNYHQKIVFSATSCQLGPATLRGSNFSSFFVRVSYLGCWLRLWLWWAERELNKSFSPTKTERSLREPETNQVFLCIGIQNLLAYAVLQVNPYHWRSLSQFLVVFSLGKNQCSTVGVA